MSILDYIPFLKKLSRNRTLELPEDLKIGSDTTFSEAVTKCNEAIEKLYNSDRVQTASEFKLSGYSPDSSLSHKLLISIPGATVQELKGFAASFTLIPGSHYEIITNDKFNGIKATVSKKLLLDTYIPEHSLDLEYVFADPVLLVKNTGINLCKNSAHIDSAKLTIVEKMDERVRNEQAAHQYQISPEDYALLESRLGAAKRLGEAILKDSVKRQI